MYRTVGERAGEGQTSAVLHEQRDLVLTNIRFLHAVSNTALSLHLPTVLVHTQPFRLSPSIFT